MELSRLEKDTIVDMLNRADGEDIEELINRSGFEDYLLHSLVMKATWESVNYYIEEKKQFTSN